jgi:hypothetical protein
MKALQNKQKSYHNKRKRALEFPKGDPTLTHMKTTETLNIKDNCVPEIIQKDNC